MRNRTMLTGGAIGVVVGVLLSAAVVLAGGLNPSGGSGEAGSQMYTLQQIYERLDTGAAGSEMGAFTEPSSGPGTATMRTLDEVMAAAPALDNANGAIAADVAVGKTFWGLTAGAWGVQMGAAAEGSDVNGADGAKTFAIPDGLYAGKMATANDSDLAPENIVSGVDIFGVEGTYTGSSPYNAVVPKTGQTTSVAARDDGDLKKGAGWPSPRFTDNLDGTVTDNLTGLMWLKDADAGNDCAGADTGTEDWATALASAAACNTTGSGYAGYTDWRLPNVRELQSLIDYGRSGPALPSGHPFAGVSSSIMNFWSSTVNASYTSNAWYVGLRTGNVADVARTSKYYVWPVRGGQ